jgi:Ca-activated chloride channel family protein
MRPYFAALLVGLFAAGVSHGQGLLIPTQTDVPPLAIASQEVRVNIEDQVAVTRVVQTFRNHTSRPLEATYIFPVPKGASVKKFTMWVDGKEVPGELVEADKARTIYSEIVRRTQDPGLLEYIGSNLLKVRVFPVPANGEQKLAVSYTSVATSDSGAIEYLYPLKADGRRMATLEKFSFEATLKAQQPIQNIYSPTHAVNIRRPNDREAVVTFDGKQESLDKDFQLYYTTANKDVGLTALVHRPNPDDKGYFMMLISPRAELSRTQQAPRDMVFVLDTSGSMQGKRIAQAKAALKFCLRNLSEKDRFAMIHFASEVTKYQNALVPATSKQLCQAATWVDALEATGGTNIDDALAAALAMRSSDTGRTQTVVFFTDGQPTVGVTNPDQIVKNVVAKNTANTRIFTFGVGDDVNAVLLDQLAEKTRSAATYVRESEDIEAKVSSFYAKISHPVLTNLKLTVEPSVTITEIYPPNLPDLFHGSQLVVLGRYKPHCQGFNVGLFFGLPIPWQPHLEVERYAPKVTLAGMVGGEKQTFEYNVVFPDETNRDKAFVEDLWARRKVGYLLDQIRVNGGNKELKDEVITLAKKYGITTPYTSYLVMPDGSPRAAADWNGYYKNHGYQINSSGRGLNMVSGLTSAGTVAPAPAPNAGGTSRIGSSVWVSPTMNWAVPTLPANGQIMGPPPVAYPNYNGPVDGSGKTSGVTFAPTFAASPAAQSGKEGVDLALQLNEMRNQDRVTRATAKQAAGRKCLDLGGVWVDDGVETKMPLVKLKAQSDAYFRMLERHPEMREVFQLGNRVVWVTPSRSVLVIEPTTGEDRMSDADIDRLFVAKK